MSVKIAPNWESKGTDFCGTGDDWYYVVRSDIGVFLRSSNFNSGENTIIELHGSCKGGEHYLATPGNSDHAWYYIIKGNEYRRVTDLRTDGQGTVWALHPNCRGGTHYFGGTDSYKYIVFADRNRYRRVTDMTDDLQAGEWDLHPDCQGGLYYWACGKYKYFLKQTQWGVEYHRCTDLTNNLEHKSWSVHKTVVSFLPGGLAINIGPTYGKWELLKRITNDTGAEVKWTKKITKKQGYNKEVLSSTEHNWNISSTVQTSAGVLTESIAKVQFSVTAAYGGKQIDTNKENWSEATEVEETLELSLSNNESAYAWQYQIGMGANEDKPILFCRNLVLTETATPPNYPGISST